MQLADTSSRIRSNSINGVVKRVHVKERSRPVTQPSYSTSSDVRPMAQKPKKNSGSRFTSGHLLMVVSGLLAFLLTLVVLNGRQATITVFTAKQDIVAGQLLSLSQFEPKSVPSSGLNDKFVSAADLTSDKKYYAARTIAKDEPLLSRDRTPEATQSDVRLLSIPIDKSLAVAGAISRGDRIDIVQTPEDSCAVRVLRNLEVVVTPSSSGGGALGGSSGAFTITVAIDRAGDDLTLAGVIAAGSFQIVKTTGARDTGAILTDPYCENGFEGQEDQDSDPVGG